MNTKKKKYKKEEIQKKGKDKKKSVPVSPALYHGIFRLFLAGLGYTLLE
jgi:hypothetical protein